MKQAKASEAGFEKDAVSDWSPVSFALAFVRRMRGKKLHVHHRPSVRTALAIPRFLTARYFRTGSLNYSDYIAAATLNTPYEDQAKAQMIAREILFPEDQKKKGKSGKTDGATGDSADSSSSEGGVDDIIAGLGDLNLDLDGFDDLENLLDEQGGAGDLSAYDLFEKLISSDDSEECALGELLRLFGGASEMEVNGIDSIEAARHFVGDNLNQSIGALAPNHFVHGCAAGFGNLLSREATLPWELAAALAGAGNTAALESHLNDVAANGTATDIGRTVAFLRPFSEVIDSTRIDDLVEQGLMKVRHLGDYIAMLEAMGEWIDPPQGLLEREAKANPIQALRAADWIQKRFEKSLHEEIFDYWVNGLGREPTLEELIPLQVPTERYDDLLDAAYDFYLGDLQDRFLNDKEQRHLILQEALRTAHLMKKAGGTLLANLAALFANDLLQIPSNKTLFLTLLDDLLALKITPHDTELVLNKALSLGIDPEEIHRRLGKAYEQLKQMIGADVRDAARYARLLQRIQNLPEDELEDLVLTCHKTGNQEAMAVLLALSLGPATDYCPDGEFVISSLCFKGIGGGDNLLRQWFQHGRNLPGRLRNRIKDLAKAALLELSLGWSGRGGGSLDTGIIPQNHVRPFGGSDDIDHLDIENTLDAMTGSGRALDDLSEDDLMVYDTSKGRRRSWCCSIFRGACQGRSWRRVRWPQ